MDEGWTDGDYPSRIDIIIGDSNGSILAAECYKFGVFQNPTHSLIWCILFLYPNNKYGY